MKNKALLFSISLTFSLLSCSSDPCKEGYTEITENGSSFCVPEYIVGIEKIFTDETTFYHPQYGVINYTNGKWEDQFGEDLSEELGL